MGARAGEAARGGVGINAASLVSRRFAASIAAADGSALVGAIAPISNWLAPGSSFGFGACVGLSGAMRSGPKDVLYRPPVCAGLGQ